MCSSSLVSARLRPLIGRKRHRDDLAWLGNDQLDTDPISDETEDDDSVPLSVRAKLDLLQEDDDETFFADAEDNFAPGKPRS